MTQNLDGSQASAPVLGAESIAALLQRDIKPVLLLGAGASIKSGIPLAGALVDAIARFAYCKVHNRNPDDPTLMRSDWIRWLEQQSWYRSDIPAANLYPFAVEHLLRPQGNRKEFFQRILKPDVPESEGYKRLAKLLARGLVRTVLTTNFDDLVVRTVKQTPSVRQIEEIFTNADHTLFRNDPPYPQVVYLHGSVNHYTDRNLVTETQQLDLALIQLLQPLLRDHPLVVIGYRGAEASIMKHLLIDQAPQCGNYREGIYWCHRRGSSPTNGSPLVSELAATIGGNLQFCEIEGFDELLIAIDRAVAASSAGVWMPAKAVESAQPISPVHDLQPSALSLDGLNEPMLRSKLIEYSEAMRIAKPVLDTPDQLWSAMFAQSLATTAGEQWVATIGGQLLFAKGAERQVVSAQIQVIVKGPARWVDEVLDQTSQREHDEEIQESSVIGGDLWAQFEQASNLLSRVNRPFRLKGQVSQTAYPYPPLALKELLTNLLAHRTYETSDVARLHVSLKEIRFENPGGLVESVRVQLEDESIQQVIGEGVRQLKGYRNPVVADFFFSAGAMDKEGSGLPDVVQEAANNLNSVEFGPDESNAAFVAVIRCRPEALLVDQDTKTAKQQQSELRYSPNLLEIVSWPDVITKFGTVAAPKEVGELAKTNCAPFGVHKEWIWTFARKDHSDTRPLLELSIDDEQYAVKASELLGAPDAISVLPRLLNMALGTHLRRLGMTVRFESGRIRAYFSSLAGAPREISYKSTFKQSKRTVAKPIISKSTGKVVYWEHKAVSLRFEKFHTTWALSLLPGYVFTTDGDLEPIASERIGPLSTRRAARDYNPTVLHDLVFWCRMLASGSETEIHIPLSTVDTTIRASLVPMIPTYMFQELADLAVSDALEASPLDDEELEQLQEQIEQAIADADAATKESENDEASPS